jgi:hypothetical protein
MNPVATDIAQQIMFRHYSWQQKRHIANDPARARDQYLGSVEQVSFEYALMLGSLTTETYLKLMEWQAQLWHNYG